MFKCGSHQSNLKRPINTPQMKFCALQRCWNQQSLYMLKCQDCPSGIWLSSFCGVSKSSAQAVLWVQFSEYI